MRQRLLEARRKDSGFTLIELLIVIVILGVLAAVVVFAVGAFDDRGEEAACRSDVKTVEVAVEAYRAKTGEYPGQLTDLTDGGYLRNLPPDKDSGVGDYYITYDSNDGTVVGTIRKTGRDCFASAESTATS